MSSVRMQKINSLIQRNLSEIINKKISGKISFASINLVSTSKDLNSTRVYVNFSAPDQKKKFTKLQKIKGLIQKKFGQDINLRKTPKIEFIFDVKQNKINKVEKILDKISKQNEN